MVKILFVRHGETDSNKSKIIMGHSDIPLNARGKSQAVLCGKYLANTIPVFSKIYCSTLLRATESINIIMDQFQENIPKIEYVRDIAERSFGDLEGKPVEYVFSKLINNKGEYDISIQPPNGETALHFYKRCSLAIDKIIKESNSNKDEIILVLTHGGTIRHILGHLLLSKNNIYNNFPVNSANCSLTLLNIDSLTQEVVEIEYLNYYHYLLKKG